jgi:hypothetical protein
MKSLSNLRASWASYMTEMVLAREERLVLWDGLLMGSGGGGALVSVLWLLSCYNATLTCL